MRIAAQFGDGNRGCQAQANYCRQRLVTDEVTSGKNRDSGFFTSLRNNRKLCAATLKIENGVRGIPLSEEILFGL